MATYREIQEWTYNKFNYVPETCWSADVKEQCGMPVRRAWNRLSDERKVPCPDDKVNDIKAAFRHFGMIKEREQ